MMKYIEKFYKQGSYPVPIDENNRPITSVSPNGKRPAWSVIMGWSKVTRGFKWGLICGEASNGLIVVNFNDQKIYEDYFKGINTLTVKTPFKGYQLYLRSKMKTSTEKKIYGFPIDIIGEKDCVICPGLKSDEGTWQIVVDYPILEVSDPLLLLKERLHLNNKGVNENIQNTKDTVQNKTALFAKESKSLSEVTLVPLNQRADTVPQSVHQSQEVPPADASNFLKIMKRRPLNLQFPGEHFISKFFKWTSDIADQEEAVLAGFFLLSTIANEHVQIRFKQEPISAALGIILLGNDITSSKTIINKTQSALSAVRIIGGDYESYADNRYLKNLPEQPSAFYIKDDIINVDLFSSGINGFPRAIAGRKSGNTGEYSFKNRFVFNLFASTLDSYTRNTKTEDLIAGYLSGLLFAVQSDKKPFIPLKLETDNDIEAWGDLVMHLMRIQQGIETKGIINFLIENDALSYLEAEHRKLEESKHLNNNPLYSSIIERAIPYAFKLAMLYELGKKVPSNVITLQSIKTCFDLVINYFVPTIIEIAAIIEEDTRRQRVSKVLCYLKKHNGSAIHTVMMHDLKLMSCHFKEVIETLIKGGYIEKYQEANEKNTRYRLLNTVSSNHENTEIQRDPRTPQAPGTPKESSEISGISEISNKTGIQDQAVADELLSGCVSPGFEINIHRECKRGVNQS